MSAQMTHRMLARPFASDESSDLRRVVAWAGIARPDFMDPHATPAQAARSFLNAAQNPESIYLAVVDENPDTGFRCREESFRGLTTTTTILRGPVAVLSVFQDAVNVAYVDPHFRKNPMLVSAVHRLAESMNRSRALVAA